ncbi:MAG: hypothetical protein AMJ42_02640 [Deltaproteobacteria bacterium DG_8]|nr:MAG: hypothetical protein AMJ42_02640 [Deltaproteobacteria bacterium DG_8]
MKKRETLWMRYVDFEKIKDMLHLVYENNGKLRAGTLEQLGIEEGILVKKENGIPLTHSPRYHYRKVMEGLDLVEVREKIYHILEDERVLEFIELTSFKKDMSPEAKGILREIIVGNNDCRKYFFDVFMEKDTYTLEDLRKEGEYIIVETKSMREPSADKRMEQKKNNENIRKKKKAGAVILKNPSGKEIELKTQDEIHAIYWGVRLWALELEMTDEIFMSFAEGRIIYPINSDFSDKILINHLLNKIKADNSDSEWVVLHIPTFIKEVALSTRFSVDKIKNFLKDLKIKYPLSTMLIPSSTMFIDIKTPFEKQDSAFRDSYLYKQGIGYISHLRIGRGILKEVKA